MKAFEIKNKIKIRSIWGERVKVVWLAQIPKWISK
jgi:hypothetical protein